MTPAEGRCAGRATYRRPHTQRDRAAREKLGVQRRHLDRRRALRRSATAAERLLWRALRARANDGLKFRRQHALGPFIVDLYCAAMQLVVEIDGGQHFDAAERRRDEARTRWLEQHGVRVLRFTNRDVLANVEGVVGAIHAAVSWSTGERRWPSPNLSHDVRGTEPRARVGRCTEAARSVVFVLPHRSPVPLHSVGEAR